jgi:hypothetical protein
LVSERPRRRRFTALAAQRALHRGRAFGRNAARPLGSFKIPAGALAHFFRRFALLGRRKRYAGSPRLRKSNRDGLLGRSRAVLTSTDMVNLFSDEFSSLRRRRFSFARVATGTIDGPFFRHVDPPQ